MATFVPGFVSQAVRDWLRRSRDGYGKAPLASDPKAQLAEIEARLGPAPRATLSEVADHIAYLVETAGIDHVGIGSDFFGGPQPVGLEHVGCFPNLFAELVRRGFSRARSREDRLAQCAAGHAQGRGGRRAAARDARAGARPAGGLSGSVGATASTARPTCRNLTGNRRRPDIREEAHVSRRARGRTRRSGGHRHGRVGRDGHVSGARGAQQQARASPAGAGPEAARPLRPVPGEPRHGSSNAAWRASARGSITPASTAT